MKPKSGILYIVATPIGNLSDITFRAVSILSTVNLIAAEDTRHSKHLLNHYQIKTPIISLHEFNEVKRSNVLLERLQHGESIALISDAGTPLISDPGYRLVKTIKEAGIQVSPIPGACAFVAALSASGLATDNFVFEGFLSAKNTERKNQLGFLLSETRTIILYESPHRIVKLLQDIDEIFPSDRKIVLAKELTKTMENFISGNAKEILQWLETDEKHQKGEFAIIVEGAVSQVQSSKIEIEKLLKILGEEMSLAKAVTLAAKITGEKKNSIYQLALKFKGLFLSE